MKNLKLSYQLPSGEMRNIELSASDLVQRLLPDPTHLLATTLILDAQSPDGTSVRIWIPTIDGFDATIEIQAA